MKFSRDVWMRVGWFVLLLFAVPREVHAVYGVMDTVILTIDQTDAYKWPREQIKWDTLIAYTRDQVKLTEDLVAALGNPARGAGRIVGSVTDQTKPAEDAVALETARHAIESSRNLFDLGSRSVKTFRRDRKVEPTYQVAGETFARDRERYGTYAMEEAMAARYRTAATNAETVSQKEMGIQKDALQQLASARTVADVATIHAKLSASEQRQAVAHQKGAQAKSDFDVFRAQLSVERRRKAEADREWVQAVTERMKARALASYRAQSGGGAHP